MPSLPTFLLILIFIFVFVVPACALWWLLVGVSVVSFVCASCGLVDDGFRYSYSCSSCCPPPSSPSKLLTLSMNNFLRFLLAVAAAAALGFRGDNPTRLPGAEEDDSS
jgi:hypothetical protein